MKISAVLIVKNEEKKIERCLKSLIGKVDEIIITDTGSTDNTISIAQKYTDKIFHFTWTNNFSEARNYSLSHSSGDYNLIIDADEYITLWDQKAIQDFATQDKELGIVIQKNKIEQNHQILYQPDYITRFIPKTTFFKGAIHEQVDSDATRTLLPIELSHDGYFHRQEDKFHRNIDLLLQSLQEDPKNAYYLYQLSNEYLGLEEYKSASKYFLDGYKYILNTHSIYPQFIVNYITYCRKTKNYNDGLRIIQHSEQYLENYPDFYFESAGFYLDYVMDDSDNNINYLPLIEVCYKGCLEIGDITSHASLKGVGSFLASYNLGVFYETTNQKSLAIKYYQNAAKLGYPPAKARLNELG